MSVESLDEWRKKRANISKSKSQSKQSTASEKPGLTHIDMRDPEEEYAPLGAMYLTMMRARENPFTTRSDFARKAAEIIAICAGEGFISTKLNEEQWGNLWMITADGLQWMEWFNDNFTIRH